MDKCFNRAVSNEKIEKLISKKWEEKTRENLRLYAQSKFRFHSMIIDKDQSEMKTNIEMNIGISSYKEFVGTNLNQEAVSIATDRSVLADIIG